ncbi:hypothetical protein PGT21_011204 [Puccinia graminis f. sp. tritici]|nr:hypothetical protein PGT21_011204 [Puccinia graminis f. sp. tritici]KAA1131518.1 hypothetical protein PGTUg99_023987 [Puccinia graminis f. sp. tritici]
MIPAHEKSETHSKIDPDLNSKGVDEEGETTDHNLTYYQQMQEASLEQLAEHRALLQIFNLHQAGRIEEKWKENESLVVWLGMQIAILKRDFTEYSNCPAHEYNGENRETDEFDEEKELNELHKKVLELTKLRLLELGMFDDFPSKFELVETSRPSKNTINKRFNKLLRKIPSELFPSIRELKFKNYIQSILDGIKKITIGHKIYYNQVTADLEEKGKLKFDYLFQTIEFLLRDHFISENDLKTLFQEDHILRIFSIYFFHSSQQGFSSMVKQLTPSFITDQCFWKFGFSFSQVLDEKDKVRMNFELLIAHLFFNGNRLRGFQEWDSFEKSFGRKKYLDHLKNPDRLKLSTSLQVEGKEEVPPLSLIGTDQEFSGDVNNLVKLFLATLNGPKKTRALSGLVCELLDFINSNISPGILDRSFKKLGSSKNLRLQFDLILIPTRINYSMAVAMEFHDIAERNGLSLAPKVMESIFISYQDRVISLNKELIKVYSQFKNRYGSLSSWLKQNPEYSKINEKSLNQWLKAMSIIIEECATEAKELDRRIQAAHGTAH